VRARESQIAQLADRIAAYRASHPSQVVIALGDFNVIGELWDRYDYFRDKFGSIGGLDAARNAPDQVIYDSPWGPRWTAGYTLMKNNELATYFDKKTENQRLDYIWYFPSLDGKVHIQPTKVRALQEVRGRELSGSGFIP